ncbi:hypothetical protein NQ314_013102 [Rhamnusium bicolor]|uniref:E3 ubiquitin-protein ligase PPP1R11 n=1 Tax=Rhamnusium bicolor TaxID=1586634 RepID=A0AAV8X801_9CUCU|nr:hypothetical protein NQ314_013102 [Rhamnusium bicolor]
MDEYFDILAPFLQDVGTCQILYTKQATDMLLFINTEIKEVPTVKLKLRKPRTDRKVQWTTETVDNEHMNRKKSKCCCIYNKPRKFDESSSDDSDEECDHCHGHVDRKKQSGRPVISDSPDGGGSSTARIETSQTITIDN